MDATYAAVDELIRGVAPALLKVPGVGGSSLLAIVSARGSALQALGPDLSIRSIPAAAVRAQLCAAMESAVGAEIDALLDDVAVRPGRRYRARAAMLRERLAASRVAGWWAVRLPPGARVRAQSSSSRIWRTLAALIGAHTAAYVLWILSWWVVGRAALEGRLDRGWLIAWTLLLATVIPFELLVTWLQGRLSITAGGLLKRRLLYGALRLEPDEIRHQGAGQLLGRIVESQAIEALALSGGFLALMAIVELTIAGVIVGNITAWLAIALAGCVAGTAALAWQFFGRRRTWTARRLTMTHDLVEHMVGHRTRAAQETRSDRHDEEDRVLREYVEASRAMDRSAVCLLAAVPRAWLLVALIALTPVFVSNSASPAALAVALGGIVLAHRAFRRLALGVSNLAGAAIGWQEASDMFHAAERAASSGLPAFVDRESLEPSDATPVIEAHDLWFRYHDRGEPVLRGCHLHIHRGERLLVEGRSGSGKSTLAALLTGLRTPDSGLLLVDGADRQTLGERGWRKRIVAVPQFHENHVFMGTLLFNALMGGEWPPREADAERVEALCRELGLGELLNRMPAGVQQQVGDTGWQLSHGERSRLFIARALLQRPDVLVLDESFAQLDPDNLQRAMQSVLRRAPTVLVIAHP